MQRNMSMNFDAIATSQMIDPLAVYRALWQDDTTGRAVLTATTSGDFCLVSANDALRKVPLWQAAYVQVATAVDVLDKGLSAIFLEMYAQQLQHHCNVCIETEQTVSFELPFLAEGELNQWWQFTLCFVEKDAAKQDAAKRLSQVVLAATDISELRRAEHHMKDVAQDMRTLLDNIQDAVFVHDVTGKILDVNENVLTLHGITREEAMRYRIDQEYALPESPVHLLPELWGRALNGERVSVDWPAKRLFDGKRLILEMVLQKVVLSGQDRVIACIRDATERRQLEEKQNRLLAILEATPDMVGMSDAEGNSLYLNRAGQKRLGIPAEEANSFHISEVIPARAQASFFQETLEQALMRGSCSGEQILVNRKGEEFPVSQVLIAHKNEAGEPQYLSVIMRDVSEFKLTEVTLREQQQFLDSIYRGSNVIMFAWDVIDVETRELRCSGWNPACVEATGIGEEDVLGKTPIDVFGWENGSSVIERQFQCVTAQQSIGYEEEIVFDDAPTWWTTKLNPIRDESGEIYRIVGTTTNITDTKLHNIELEAHSMLQAQQAEALKTALSELKQTQAQVVHSEKMSSLGQMVAGIAHEINNPVNFIHANVKPASTYAAELLELISLYQSEYPQPSPKIVEMIEDLDLEFVKKDFIELLESMKIGSQRIREIVLSLRNFSRLDEADVKAVDIHAGIDSTLVILSHKLKTNLLQKPVEVIKDYGELLPVVECYPSQLNQVVMNILANAIDALSNVEQPCIRIATRAHDGQAVIAISDNGSGIPQATRANIFDPFFTTKPIGKGTGMGLSVSYQIVTERHGGRLSVESELGQGTTFTIAIPLRQSYCDKL